MIEHLTKNNKIDIQSAAELRTRHRAWWLVIDTEIDHKLRKNSREQVIKTYSQMMPKSIQNGGSGNPRKYGGPGPPPGLTG